MNTFSKFIKCLTECEVDFSKISDKEIVIPMPGFVNNSDEVIDKASIMDIVEKDLDENDFCAVHVEDHGECGLSWTIVVGEDAE